MWVEFNLNFHLPQDNIKPRIRIFQLSKPTRFIDRWGDSCNRFKNS